MKLNQKNVFLIKDLKKHILKMYMLLCTTVIKALSALNESGTFGQWTFGGGHLAG